MSRAKEIMLQINSAMVAKYKSKAPQLMMGSDLPPVSWISTGLLAYDWVNGGGGARGHIEQLWGRKSSGKTTLSLRRIAECQRLGGVAAYIDMEHTLDKAWAVKQGVNMEELILLEPEFTDSAEVVLDLIIELLRGQEIDLLVVDSVPALCPEAKLQKSMEEKHYAGVAGVLSQFFDKIIGPGILYNSDTVVIFINQPRDVIGSRIPTERLPGGRALSHYSSIINRVIQGDYIMVGSDANEEKIGQESKIINQKNKVRWPYKESTVRLHFASGFNPLWDTIHFGKRYGVVVQNGNWLYYEGEQMGNGMDQSMRWLIENQHVYYEMKAKILEMIRSDR
jgi:recombination protein RecA